MSRVLFREACETVGTFFVFNVAGIIRLESPIIVSSTVYYCPGQTAPGDSVCICRIILGGYTSDVVVRRYEIPSWRNKSMAS